MEDLIEEISGDFEQLAFHHKMVGVPTCMVKLAPSWVQRYFC